MFHSVKKLIDKNEVILNLPTSNKSRLAGGYNFGKKVFDFVCKYFGEDFVEDIIETGGFELCDKRCSNFFRDKGNKTVVNLF